MGCCSSPRSTIAGVGILHLMVAMGCLGLCGYLLTLDDASLEMVFMDSWSLLTTMHLPVVVDTEGNVINRDSAVLNKDKGVIYSDRDEADRTNDSKTLSIQGRSAQDIVVVSIREDGAGENDDVNHNAYENLENVLTSAYVDYDNDTVSVELEDVTVVENVYTERGVIDSTEANSSGTHLRTVNITGEVVENSTESEYSLNEFSVITANSEESDVESISGTLVNETLSLEGEAILNETKSFVTETMYREEEAIANGTMYRGEEAIANETTLFYDDVAIANETMYRGEEAISNETMYRGEEAISNETRSLGEESIANETTLFYDDVAIANETMYRGEEAISNEAMYRGEEEITNETMSLGGETIASETTLSYEDFAIVNETLSHEDVTIVNETLTHEDVVIVNETLSHEDVAISNETSSGRKEETSNVSMLTDESDIVSPNETSSLDMRDTATMNEASELVEETHSNDIVSSNMMTLDRDNESTIAVNASELSGDYTVNDLDYSSVLYVEETQPNVTDAITTSFPTPGVLNAFIGSRGFLSTLASTLTTAVLESTTELAPSQAPPTTMSSTSVSDSIDQETLPTPSLSLVITSIEPNSPAPPRSAEDNVTELAEPLPSASALRIEDDARYSLSSNNGSNSVADLDGTVSDVNLTFDGITVPPIITTTGFITTILANPVKGLDADDELHHLLRQLQLSLAVLTVLWFAIICAIASLLLLVAAATRVPAFVVPWLVVQWVAVLAAVAGVGVLTWRLVVAGVALWCWWLVVLSIAGVVVLVLCLVLVMEAHQAMPSEAARQQDFTDSYEMRYITEK